MRDHTSHGLKILCFKCETFPLSDFLNISPVMCIDNNKNKGKKISLGIFCFYHDFDGIWMMVVDFFLELGNLRFGYQ